MSTLLYASEKWTLEKHDTKRLDAFELNIVEDCFMLNGQRKEQLHKT